ncbi:MAG: hypothetical protein V2A34_07225, partial [Lentisphaerota bacterium]
MSTNEDTIGTLRDRVEIIFRHKLLVAVFSGLVVFAALLMLAATPDTYTSFSKVLVRRGHESAVLDPTAATGEMIPLYKEWENEINSEIEILGSVELAEAVVAAVGPERILNPPRPSLRGMLGPLRMVVQGLQGAGRATGRYFSGLFRGGDRAALLKDDRTRKAVEVLAKNLTIVAPKKSDVITLSYAALTPDLAQAVLSALIKAYEDKRLLVRSSPDARRFFKEQTDQLLKELTGTEEALRRLKSEAGIVSLDGNRASLADRLAKLQLQKYSISSDLLASRAKVSTLQTLARGETNNAARTATVRTDFKDIQTALRLEETTLSALAAQSAELNRQMAETRAEMEKLNGREAALLDLQRRHDLLESTYRKYSDNLEQARIDQALEEEKISNVSTVQAPTFPSQPDPARKAVKLLLALLLGLMGGTLMAFGLDQASSTVHRPDDAERKLQLTPLAAIPELRGGKLLPQLQTRTGESDQDAHRLLRDGREPGGNVEVHFARLLRRVLAVRSLLASPPLVLGVTSCYGKEGVTSIAANLAVAFARFNDQAKVLYLDANRQPHSTDYKDFLSEARGGLEVGFDEAGKARFTPRHLEGGAETGGKPGTAIERISRDRITPLLRRAAAAGFDVVVVDIPPLSEGSDSEHVAGLMKAVILVVEAERDRWPTVLWAKSLLADAGTNILGIVLNRQKFHMPAWLYR